MSTTLDLVLTKEYFDAIESGEKTEEYRLVKPHWEKLSYKLYERVRFRHGYMPDARKMCFEIVGIHIDERNYMGKKNVKVYVISLGARVVTS
jgi:ASC-1-like (ASCH) protein